jgi:hypothetical protein
MRRDAPSRARSADALRGGEGGEQFGAGRALACFARRGDERLHMDLAPVLALERRGYEQRGQAAPACADHIIVMNKGTIVQQGTYESLMAEPGLFRTLAQSQLASEATPAA